MADIDFQAARVKMVDGQLRTTDVTSHEILAAFLEIPREKFVPANRRELAYLDDDIEIAPGRFLTEPSPLAKLLQLASIETDEKVLLIGAGNGYSAAILSRLAKNVVAIEENADLSSVAKANLKAAGAANVEVLISPLSGGAASAAPYDVILFDGSVSAVPDSFFDQLSNTGRLIAVVGEGRIGVATVFTKNDSHISSVSGFNVAVKALPGFSAKPKFTF